MDQFMGNMFYREQPMSEIRAADYDDLKYFNVWHKQIERAEVNAANNARNTGKGKGRK
jgi:hypothetical protein